MDSKEKEIKEIAIEEESTQDAASVLMKGASVLVIAAIISKIFGAIFRIPLTNMIGTEGQAYYSAAYPVYQLFYTIATAGFPVAISKMVSERVALGDYINAHKSYKLALKVSTIIGIVAFVVMYLGAGAIAEFYRNPGAEMSMKAVSFALLFTPVLASLRGYYQGRQEMIPTGVTEVIEQFVRVVVGLSLAYAFYKVSLQNAAAGATFGASAGVIAGLIIMVIIYAKDKPKRKLQMEGSIIREENDRKRAKELFWYVIPITIGSSIMPIMFNIDSAIVIRRLMATGWSHTESLKLFGLMGGYCDPIVSLPSVIIEAICISMMPAVTRAFTLRNQSELNNNIKTGLKTMMIVSCPCMIGLMVLARPILEMLFPKRIDEAHMAVITLQVLSATIVTFAFMRAFSTCLQGIGKMMLPVGNLFIGAVIKIIVSYILIGIHAVNINGAAASSVIAYIAAATLNFIALKKYADVSLDLKSVFIMPFISSLIMGAATIAAYKLLYLVTSSNIISTGLAIIIAVIVYFVTAFKTKAVTKEEIELIPKGDVLYRFAVKLRIAS